jgi:hypothetical protein
MISSALEIIDPASTAGVIDLVMDDDDLQTECAICLEHVIDPVPREPNQQSTTTLGCSHKYRECTFNTHQCGTSCHVYILQATAMHT